MRKAKQQTLSLVYFINGLANCDYNPMSARVRLPLLPKSSRKLSVDAFQWNGGSAQTDICEQSYNNCAPSITTFIFAHKTVDDTQCLCNGHPSLILGQSIRSLEDRLYLALPQYFFDELLCGSLSHKHLWVTAYLLGRPCFICRIDFHTVTEAGAPNGTLAA